MGNKTKEIHYKFALELVGATMLRHVEFAEAGKEWHKILKSSLQTGFKTIQSIDALFVPIQGSGIFRSDNGNCHLRFAVRGVPFLQILSIEPRPVDTFLIR